MPGEVHCWFDYSSPFAYLGTTQIERVAREAGPASLPAMLDAVEAALRPHAAADGSVALPGRVWIVTARTG